ncbi:hypothetical protein, partial [Moraxella catarrhalis]
KSIEEIDPYELRDYIEYPTAIERFLLLSQYGNTLTLEEFDNDIELLDQDVEDLEESVTELAKNQNSLIEQGEAIKEDLQGLADFVERQEDKIL